MKKYVLWLILLLVLRQFDDGLHPIKAQEISIEPVQTLSANLKINHIVYMGELKESLWLATNEGIYSTNDRGETWTSQNKGLPNGEVIRLFYLPQPTLILASVQNYGVWKWQPAGKNWVSFNSNLPAKQIISFYSTEKFIYAGSNREGLFRVKIGAEKWQDVNFDDKNPFLAQLKIQDIVFFNEKIGWLGSDKGLVVTDNEGELWKIQESNSLTNTSILTLSSSEDRKTFLAGTEDKGIFASFDSGKSWTEWHPDGLPPLPFTVRSIQIESGKKRYWVGTNNGLWVSSLTSLQFEPIALLSEKKILSIAHTTMGAWEAVWIGTEQNGFYLSCSVKPPTKPHHLKYSIGKKKVSLSWDTSIPGSRPIAGYSIFRKKNSELTFQLIGTTKNQQWEDTNVEWLDLFDYTIQAYDESSPPINSSESDLLTVLVDDYPSLVIEFPSPEYITTDSSLIITGNALDEGSGIQVINLTMAYPSEKLETYQLMVQEDGFFSQSVPLEIGLNQCTIEVIDNKSHLSKDTRQITRKEIEKDMVPPIIVVDAPKDNFSNEAATIQVRGKITDAENHLLESRLWIGFSGTKLYYRVISVDTNGIFQETISLPYGEVSIHIQAVDTFGNQSEKTIHGMNTEPDSKPPRYYILSPANLFETEEEEIRFYGRAWDEESGIQSVIIMVEYLSKKMYEKVLPQDEQGFFDQTLSLMEGENQLTLIVLDKKNNEAKETRTIIRKAKPKTIVIELVIGKNTALLNGDSIDLLYPPEIKKGRTFIPVRFVSESFGANVLWIAQRKEIQITWKEIFITLWLHKTIVTIESLVKPDEIPKTVFLEYPPYLAKGVTMVPLRLIAEQFGIQPQWNAATQTILLTLIP